MREVEFMGRKLQEKNDGDWWLVDEKDEITSIFYEHIPEAVEKIRTTFDIQGDFKLNSHTQHAEVKTARSVSDFSDLSKDDAINLALRILELAKGE